MTYRELYVVRDLDPVIDMLKGMGIYLNSGDREEVERYEKFRGLGIPHKFFPYKRTFELLGTTWDFAILDLTRQFVPNDIARVVETVRAGGKLVFITPDLESWKKEVFKFHRTMIPLPYSIHDLEHNFMERFLLVLKRHPNVFLQDGNSFVGNRIESRKHATYSPLNKWPFNLCASQDQENALKVLNSWFDSEERRFVLIADRGRGKSALLGIFSAWLVSKRRARKIIVTAPNQAGVQVLFQFLHKSLRKIGMHHKVKRAGEFIFEISGRNFFVRYLPPSDAGRTRDLLIVDEASSIPVFQLKKLDRGKVIFSTTVHGYEGHGRGFTLKFLKSLPSYQSFEMKTPIRYLPGDPIEAWLYDSFLLDVDLQEPRKDEYEEVARRELVKNEDELRRYFSIYIWAHYRTDPNDIMISLDAPGKILRRIGDYGILEASYEGGLSDDQIQELYESRDAPGNLIPDITLKHLGIRDFAENKGIRIVRVAIHPDYQGRGFGTRLVKSFLDEMDSIAWVGVSFGAEADLVRFWKKLGFKPIFLSPTKNPVSGEYSITMIKPVSQEMHDLVSRLVSSFVSRFVYSLPDTYRDMDPLTVKEILVSLGMKPSLGLDDIDKHRLNRFLKGNLTYESIDDLARKLALAYFSLSPGELGTSQEELLVSKVLQCKTWDELTRQLGKNETYWIIETKDIIRKIVSLING